ANVPPLEMVGPMLEGRSEVPFELQEPTQRFLSSLSFGERAALHEAAADGPSMARVVQTRWRVMAALVTRPMSAETDAAALDVLYAELDEALVALTQLATSEDDDIRLSCAAARKSLANAV